MTLRHIVSRSLVVLLCIFSQQVLAQQGDESLKVGYVNVQEVLVKAPQTEIAKKALTKEFTKRQDELKAMETAYIQTREKLQKEGLTMSADSARKLENDLLAQERKIRWNQSLLDEDYKIRQKELTDQLQKDIFQTILNIAKQEKYDLVLTDGVLMSSSRINLTARIIEDLKKNTAKK
jgi:outer membrane protein